jgi:hypothetical protein
MLLMRVEPTDLVFEPARRANVLHCVTTVIGTPLIYFQKTEIWRYYLEIYICF